MKANIMDAVLFKNWLESRGNLAESSIYYYVLGIKRFITTNPDLENIDDYNNFIVETAIKKRSHQYYSFLKKFIDFKITDANLRNRLKEHLIRPPERYDVKVERRYLSEDKILEVINYLTEPKHKVVALIQSITGVRAGDILRIRRGNILIEEYEGRKVVRLNILGKRRKRNVVYIHDKIIQDIILDYISTNYHHDDYYFLEPGRMKNRPGNLDSEFHLSSVNYNRYWEDLKVALKTANVSSEDFATHDFRRCFARRVWEKYKDIHVLQSLLNHKDPKITLRYLEQSGLKNVDYHYELQSK